MIKYCLISRENQHPGGTIPYLFQISTFSGPYDLSLLLLPGLALLFVLHHPFSIVQSDYKHCPLSNHIVITLSSSIVHCPITESV